MTGDRWQMTGDKWQVPHGVGWKFSQNYRSLAITDWALWCFEDGGGKGSVNEWVTKGLQHTKILIHIGLPTLLIHKMWIKKLMFFNPFLSEVKLAQTASSFSWCTQVNVGWPCQDFIKSRQSLQMCSSSKWSEVEPEYWIENFWSLLLMS